MKKIILNHGYECFVDNGDFIRLNKHKWFALKKDDGRIYACRGSKKIDKLEKRTTIQMHREVTGAKCGIVVDHKNHNTLDNRKCNLRLCNHAENMRNRKLQKNNTSGFRGIWFDRRCKNRPWIALIRNGSKNQVRIGSFATKEEASEAYKKASLKYHGEFSPYAT